MGRQTADRFADRTICWLMQIPFVPSLTTRVLPLLMGLGVSVPLLALLMLAAGIHPLESTPMHAVIAGEGLVHLLEHVLGRYAWNTLMVSLVAMAVAGSIGVLAGWLVAAYQFPGRSWMSWALLMPLAIPPYVMAFAFTDFLDVSGPLQHSLRELFSMSLTPSTSLSVRTPWGAGICLGLALYPYIYMLARGAFAERSASLGEAARSLGTPSWQVWPKVIWPIARPSVAAGSALVLMEVLADFGTVSYFATDTLTAGIYKAWQGMGDKLSAARLAIVLLMAVGVLVWIERQQRARRTLASRSWRPAQVQVLEGWPAWRASALCFFPILIAFIGPVAILLHALEPLAPEQFARLGQWLQHSVLLAALSVWVIIPAAVLLAYVGRLNPSGWVKSITALANAGYALPGVVIGVGILSTSAWLGSWLPLLNEWLGHGLLLGLLLLIYAYGVRFFSVGFQGIEAALKRISPSMDQSAQSLGHSAWQILRRVHWPLLKPTVTACALLVFVDALKELPATLVLRPFNFDTLAVVAYQFASDERLGEAAWPCLLMVTIGLVPIWWLASVQRKTAML
ncbi:MAG: iron(III) ABC-type transport system permease protein [Pseudomonadota bacterium]|jgi:iron(III) transport system permease protein